VLSPDREGWEESASADLTGKEGDHTTSPSGKGASASTKKETPPGGRNVEGGLW